MNRHLAFEAPKKLKSQMTVPDMLGMPDSRMNALFDIFEQAQRLDSIPASLAYISQQVETPQELIFLSHLTIREMEKAHDYYGAANNATC